MQEALLPNDDEAGSHNDDQTVEHDHHKPCINDYYDFVYDDE